MHCGRANARHIRGRVHIDKIERCGLGWRLGVVFHGAKCAASEAAWRGRWGTWRSLTVAIWGLAHFDIEAGSRVTTG